MDYENCLLVEAEHGGSRAAQNAWKTQCPDEYILNGIFSSNENFQLEKIRCCPLQESLISQVDDSCEVSGKLNYLDDGYSAAELRWNAQCEQVTAFFVIFTKLAKSSMFAGEIPNSFVEETGVISSMYDDNNDFKDIDYR